MNLFQSWTRAGRRALATLFILAPCQLIAHPLTMDDVLETVTIDAAVLSPDGNQVAVSVPRPASPGETYGRNAYEIDPSRNDVWLLSRDGRERRNLTGGAPTAAGFWCPAWSPDGRSLAMLSTQPEGAEPRGGSDVHLYIWRSGSVKPQRLTSRAVMTQTRYGSPLNAMDIRGPAEGGARSCRTFDENAPFLWLDDHRMLAVLMPQGQHSAMVERYALPQEEAARAAVQMREGAEPTVSQSDSGEASGDADHSRFFADIVIIDAASGETRVIAKVPAFPFRGALTLALAPDGKKVAVLAPKAAILPDQLGPAPFNQDSWNVVNWLGFLELDRPSEVRWVHLPAEARLPLDVQSWSPDSKKVAFRARGQGADHEAGLWQVEHSDGSVRRLARDLAIGSVSTTSTGGMPSAYWVSAQTLLVHGVKASGSTKAGWYLAGQDLGATVAGGQSEPIASLQQSSDGRISGRAGEKFVTFSAKTQSFEPMAAAVAAPSCTARSHLLSHSRVGQLELSRWDDSGSSTDTVRIPASALVMDSDCSGLLWAEQGRRGLILHASSWARGADKPLLELDQHLAEVEWGDTRIVAYRDVNGTEQKAAVILPPGYDPKVRYPTLVWVYGGQIIHGPDEYWLDPYLPGIYNLQLYAAQGYVVLVPSMPLPNDAGPNEPLRHLADGVLPAIDRLVELGITDNARVGVFGQSYGGYSVYGLVTQTKRFAGAVALAGVTDQAISHGGFDPSARGYPGIEQDMSANAVITETGLHFNTTPVADPDLYARNSPLTYVANVTTPLLMIHGELDLRGGLNHPETFFSELYRQGKTARLLRYWGESHSLANSPANVRDMQASITDWFDTYVKKQKITD